MFDFFNKADKKLKQSHLYSPKVSVVAIAKDEAAYIHEWIHHYLFMGFDKIFIGLNRITDETELVLKKIQAAFPNVFFFSVDWIDAGTNQVKNSQMQSLSYAFLSDYIVNNHKDCTHILYCDVDEFLIADAFNKTIQEIIIDAGQFDSLSFNWLNQAGDKAPFLRPFENLKFEANRHMKSIHSVKSLHKIAEFRCHCSKYKSDYEAKQVDANGKNVKHGEHDQVFKSDITASVPVHILHRMMRSEKEYTSMLLRERPGVDVPIKNNRSGFSFASTNTLSIDASDLKRYWISLDYFIKYCELDSLLRDIRNKILEKSRSVLGRPPKVIAAHFSSYFNVLKGTTYHDKIIDVLETAGSEIYIDEYAKKFHEASVAKEAEGKIELAYRYALLASRCRPNGPVINDNLERIKKLL